MFNTASINAFYSILIFALALGIARPAASHCQIPCGIYDDNAQVRAMLLDAVTVEKSVRLLAELVKKDDVQSRQQFVRWVMNKESHSQKIITSISDYFLTQRVNAGQKDYTERLKKHHAVIVAAMKTKQNTDLSHAKTLTKAIEALLPYYPEHKHEE